MRILIAAAVALLAAGVLDARSASAAWECLGPAASCQSVKSANKVHAVKSASVAKVHKAKLSPAKRAKNTGVASKAAKKKSYRVAAGSSYSGIASYYWQPQRVASGGWFNPNAMTAAHKTLPFGTRVQVTNRNNGRSVVVTINDRGPYIKGRIIDLSRAAAQKVGMTGSGIAPVTVSVIGRG